MEKTKTHNDFTIHCKQIQYTKKKSSSKESTKQTLTAVGHTVLHNNIHENNRNSKNTKHLIKKIIHGQRHYVANFTTN